MGLLPPPPPPCEHYPPEAGCFGFYRQPQTSSPHAVSVCLRPLRLVLWTSATDTVKKWALQPLRCWTMIYRPSHIATDGPNLGLWLPISCLDNRVWNSRRIGIPTGPPDTVRARSARSKRRGQSCPTCGAAPPTSPRRRPGATRPRAGPAAEGSPPTLVPIPLQSKARRLSHQTWTHRDSAGPSLRRWTSFAGTAKAQRSPSAKVQRPADATGVSSPSYMPPSFSRQGTVSSVADQWPSAASQVAPPPPPSCTSGA